MTYSLPSRPKATLSSSRNYYKNKTHKTVKVKTKLEITQRVQTSDDDFRVLFLADRKNPFKQVVAAEI